jgi:hypothetical protein
VAGGQVEVTVTLPDYLKVPGRSNTVYLALYNKDGRLNSMATYTVVDGGVVQSEVYKFNIPSNTAGMTFKAFLWNDLFIPLIKEATLN